MRVLQVAYGTELAGGERVLLQLCRALQGAGHEVHVAVPGAGGLSRALDALGIGSTEVPMRRTYDLGAVRRLVEVLRAQGSQLLHSHGMLVNVLGRMAARWCGDLPSVSSVHLTLGLGGRPNLPGLGPLLKARLYYRPLDTWTSRWNRAVVAVSEAVRRDLLEQGYRPERVRVIRNGMETDRFDGVTREEAAATRASLGAAPDDWLVAAVARLSPQKDVACFLRAFGAVAARCPRARAVVAGGGALEAALRQQAAALGLGGRLQLLGDRADVPQLLRAADAFALSSRWEGLPLSVLEAMACRLPVVATAVPGTAEAVVPGETGTLVPVGDHEALGAGLLALAEDPARGRAMGEAGRLRLEREFAVTRTQEAHLRLYQEVLAA